MNYSDVLIRTHVLVEKQITVENRYNHQLIDARIKEYIQNSREMSPKVAKSTRLVYDYMDKDYYPSKNDRINQLELLNIEELVLDILVGVAHHLKPVLFTSVVAQIAGRLGFSDKTEAITTVAELLAVICEADLFDITKKDRMASLKIVSNMALNKELIISIEECQYLPPMLCKPALLEHNYSSGYLTHTESLILGTGNHHSGDICLDALNIMNSTALCLNKKFLDTVPEEATFDLDTPKKQEHWGKFKAQSAELYRSLGHQDTEFYLTHQYDKRGRIYCNGYHISTQGNAYKKAMIDLAHKEVVTGVPN